MIILTFDLETENHKLNKRVASSFDPRNYIVMVGWSVNGGERKQKYYKENHREPVMPVEVLNQMGKGDIINGFNIKFDLLWVWREPALRAALKRGVTIYCGQYVEYLLGGMTQDVQMCSMNDIATNYGGGCKIDAVKEMWEEGCLTSEIPRDLLTDYLVGTKEIVGDVQNTWLIYVGQIKRMKKYFPKEFRTMLKFRMDGLLATTEMEYNGMLVNAQKGEELRLDLMEKLEAASNKLDSFIPELPPELIFNWGSPQMASCIIFGGTVKYEKWLPHKDENGNILYAKKKVEFPLFDIPVLEEDKWILKKDVPVDPENTKVAGALHVMEVPTGTPNTVSRKGKTYLVQKRYQGGQKRGLGKTKQMSVPDLTKPKGAKQPHYFTFKGYTKPNKSWLGAMTDAFDKPVYSVAASVIEELSKRGLPFTDALAERTSILKDLGTYYYMEDKKGNKKGMLTLLGEDNILHHKLNHTSTVTSRLSCSDPNLQTLPRKGTSKVKQMFTSRFENGSLAEIDYSQLEVVVQGVLSRDKQLMIDLNNKVDFHCKRLAAKLNENYEDVLHKCKVEEDEEYCKMRTGAKAFSFQRAYGAGVDAVVQSTGMSKADVEALVEAENKLYPMVAEFDKMLETTIKNNRIKTDKKLFLEGVAFTQGESHWDSPTGTRYVWREGITPDFMHKHGKYTGFSPTERKNYPVQGFGGEIVQTMLGKVFRYMLENDNFNDKVLLINTVHDCVLLDGDTETIKPVAKEVQKILESVPEVFNTAYPDLRIEVPFPCETEIGKDLYKMEVLH